MSTKLTDLLGVEFVVGNQVARAKKAGYATNIELRTVTRIENGKLYLDDSKVPVNYPGRMLIIDDIYKYRDLCK